MAKITISMPDRMSDYVTGRIESGQYGNVSEFFRDLVRRDQGNLGGTINPHYLGFLGALANQVQTLNTLGFDIDQVAADVSRGFHDSGGAKRLDGPQGVFNHAGKQLAKVFLPVVE